MSDMKYLDFDVAIEPTAEGYATRVFNSPVGQAASTFGAPFSDLEIENFLLRVGRSRHAVRRIESPEMASAKAFGGRLFDQVFTGEVRGCLRSSIDEASRQGTGLRVRLHLTKVPALADLPWEFLYNASMNRFLSLSVETPLVRYLELPERIRPLTVQPPLHVLMMISSPSDYPQLDVNREAAKMTEALSDLEQRGLVTVERQEAATLSELQRRLRSSQYHIFHFVGHGGFDAQADDGLLIMEDQENRGRRVSAQFLGTLLHDHRPLRLAVLNACEGARASRGDPFAGTAQSLVQQGIPAVIAMQFEVTDEAAICFTREFYAAIAIGYPVDAALAEARKAIFAEVSEIEWGTPVLYMRSPDGRVFEVEQVSEAARKQLQISSLVSGARTAAASGDQPGAIDKLKQVLALEPAHADATALLHDISQERELDDLYTAARAACEAGRWREALDRLGRVQSINRTYKDLTTLITQAERELAKADSDEQRKQRTSDLRQAAAGAMAAGLWDEAIAKWQVVLALEPDDQQVRAQLAEAHRQQELSTLYARARQQVDRRNWRDALAEFRHLQRLAPDYKDVAARVAAVDTELKHAIEEESRAQRAAADRAAHAVSDAQRSSEVESHVATAQRRPVGWFVMGGALGAVAVIAMLVVAGITMVVFLAGQRDAEPKGQPVQLIDSKVAQTVPRTAAVDPPNRENPTPAPAPPRAPENPPRKVQATDYDNRAQRTPPPAPVRVIPTQTVVAPPVVQPQPAPPVVQQQPAPPLVEQRPAPPVVGEPPVVTPLLRLTLQAVIRRADDVEVQAYATMNPALLNLSYTGKALERAVAEMQALASNQVYRVSRLHNQQFESFSVSRDGRRAEVRLTEVWSTDFYSTVTRRCVTHQHEHDVPQTISLELTNQGWIVHNLETYGKDPQMVACH